MALRPEARPATGADTPPDGFLRALERMRTAAMRPEVFCEEMPAPQRIAPFAAALSADVTVGDDEVGTGRLVLLHDPAGNEAWDGTFRCVAYCRSEVDLALAADPALAAVGWDWLMEALTAHGAEFTAASGTVTRVTTESFGGMADEGGTAQLEIRASWTPTGPADAAGAAGATGADEGDGVPDLAPHVEAWGELLCTAAGLEPVPDGVAVLTGRRGQRGPGH